MTESKISIGTINSDHKSFGHSKTLSIISKCPLAHITTTSASAVFGFPFLMRLPWSETWRLSVHILVDSSEPNPLCSPGLPRDETTRLSMKNSLLSRQFGSDKQVKSRRSESFYGSYTYRDVDEVYAMDD